MARHRKRKTLPETPVSATVTALTHDGRGVAHVDGKAVFIDEALPGELVEFIYTDIRKDYAEGRVSRIIEASPQRITPECPHYGVCGGCSFQHVAPDQQILIKQQLLIEQFKRIGKLDIPEIWQPLTGPHWGYRRKARMGVKYVAAKDRVLVGFREKKHQYLADINACLVMHPSVGTRLTALGEMIKGLSIRSQIPQIEVAIGDQVTVLAIRVLEPPSADDIEQMRVFSHAHNLHLCLQAKGPDSITPLPGEPEVIPTYALPEHGIVFNFRPAMFTQVNYAINQAMINRVLDALDLKPTDQVLDLFCGLGNFTLPIAKRAGKVVGIEGDLPLVNHARANAAANGINNVEFYAADLSKDISQYTWSQQRYNKILLDPSRAGAAEVLHHLAHWQPEQLIYVSCNPSTLARDAGILVHELGFTLVRAGVMDMFPHTAHVESIAWFVKNP